jgi:hypothetical protein
MKIFSRVYGISVLAFLLASCGDAPANNTSASVKPIADENNILHITWGGIALAATNEDKRHWSTWTINLVDGSAGYGWISEATGKLPLNLDFELAGPGKINSLILDSRFEPVMREDGSSSQEATGSPVRRFTVLGSTEGPNGPFEPIFTGEAKADTRNKFDLPKVPKARWLRLQIDSNWAGSGATRLAEFEVLGELDQRGVTETSDATGVYDHEYGPVVIRQKGNEIYGCYNDGLGTIRGTIYGRIMRLAWFSEKEKSIGSATLVPAHGKLYGFWYRYSDKMGSPWNATRSGDLAAASVNCRKALYPSG